MVDEKELELELKKIKDNNWVIPENEDVVGLCHRMMEHIGNINPVLRDDLIYICFYYIIDEYNLLSNKELKDLINLCISDNYLFKGVGLECDDTVFTRTFTSLLLEILLSKNNDTPYLSEDEIKHIFTKVMEYYRKEKDYRGYIEIKGWAHSTAHTSDTLCAFARNQFIGENELKEILTVIKEKICIKVYPYIYNEDERLINTFECVYQRKIIKDEDIINWINSFDDYKRDNVYPYFLYDYNNRKNFLRSLYFRLLNNGYDANLLVVEKNVLDKLPKMY